LYPSAPAVRKILSLFFDWLPPTTASTKFHTNCLLCAAGSKRYCAILRRARPGSWKRSTSPSAYALLTYNFDLEYGGIEGMLTDLYVDKHCRNRGVGSLALYEMEDFCRERGIRAIELQVLNRNKAAETFYHKAGFRNLPRKVMVMDVRSEEQQRAHRITAGKRR
jgi:ribosomal protein S18 acetylase RimI-like enzyme